MHLILYAHQTPIVFVYHLGSYTTAGVLLPWTKDNDHWDLDGLHFSRRGSQELGQRLAQYLQNEDGENGSGRSRPTWMPKMRDKKMPHHKNTNKLWVDQDVRPVDDDVCVCLFFLVSRMTANKFLYD